MAGKVTAAALSGARAFAARIVERFGEHYLPLFDRLDAEHEAQESKAARLERAKKIAEASKK